MRSCPRPLYGPLCSGLFSLTLVWGSALTASAQGAGGGSLADAAWFARGPSTTNVVGLASGPDGSVFTAVNALDGHVSFGVGCNAVRVPNQGLGSLGAVVKYAPDGSPGWVRTTSAGRAPGNVTIRALVALPDGGVAAAGFVTPDGPTYTIEGGATTAAVEFSNTASGRFTSSYVARYSADGELLWALLGKGMQVTALAAGPDGTVLAAGRTFLETSGAPTATAALRRGETVYPVGPAGAFTAHVGPDGAVARYDVVQSTGAAEFEHIAAGPAGYAVCGGYNRTATFGSGSGAVQLTGYLPPFERGYHFATFALDGRLLSAQRFSDGVCSGVSAAPDGTYAAVGVINAPWTFGSGADAYTLTLTGGRSFLARYEATGRFRGITRIGGGATLGTYGAIVAMPDGSMIVTGSYAGSALIGEVPDAMGVFSDAGGFAARVGTDGAPLEVWDYRHEPIPHAGSNLRIAMSQPAARPDGGFVVAGSVNRDVVIPTRGGSLGMQYFGGKAVFFARYSSRGGTAAEGLPATGSELGAVRPNPFGGRAVVPFTVAAPGPVRLAVYDVLGREVAVLADGERAAGSHEVALDAGRLAPGVYLVRLEAGERVLTRSVTVVP